MINQKRYNLKKKIEKGLPLKDRLLISRGLSYDQISGTIDDLYDPYLINDMEIAVSRIKEAIQNGERILIYGDYDADGITSTVIMLKGLRELGAKCSHYIPKRLEDGYGMNMESTFDILSEGYSLVITVDCGITGIEEVEFLQENNVDVIITDHHTCKETIPSAVAVLDNKREDSTYPFTEICGAVMAYKVISALYEEFQKSGDEQKYLTYAAIGTICDVMPLIDENRIIVSEGLKEIKETNDVSFICLLNAAGKLNERKNLTAQDIAFYIGPLINAASRIGDVNYAVNLLMTNIEDEALECSLKLKSFNEKRKEAEKYIYCQAVQQVLSTYNFNSFNPIVVYGEGWHRGVIGIVAAKLEEQFSRPVIVLSKEPGDNIYHGSCRSYKDINMMQMLNYASNHILQFGGHKGAAGLTVREEDINSFILKLNEYASINFDQSMFLDVGEIDLEIYPEEITIENLEEIKSLEPFGEANKEPIFVCRNLRTKVIKKIGTKQGSENAHLRITFSHDSNPLNVFDGVGFFLADYADILPSGQLVDVVFKLAENTWNGKTNIQMLVQDIIYNPKYRDGISTDEDSIYVDGLISISDIINEYSVKQEELLPSKQEYMAVYSCIGSMLSEPNNLIIITTLNYLSAMISTRINWEITPFKLSRILEALGESNHITFNRMQNDQIIIAPPLKNKAKLKLSQTTAYKKNHSVQ